MGCDYSRPLSVCTECKNDTICDCGPCTAKFKTVSNFSPSNGGDECLTLTIDEKDICITKIHAYLVEGRLFKIDVAVIEIRDKNNNIVFQHAFGDNLVEFGTESYETTFVNPVKVKGPVTATLCFYKFRPFSDGSGDSADLEPVDRRGALTISYCKDCDKSHGKHRDRD